MNKGMRVRTLHVSTKQPRSRLKNELEKTPINLTGIVFSNVYNIININFIFIHERKDEINDL